MFKNTAAKFIVFAYDSTTGLPKTGDAANITAYVSKDYGAVTVLADTSATEMDATNAKGYYLFDAAQGETNADCLMVSAKSATSNIVVVGAPATIYTRPTTGWLAPTTAGRTLDVSAGGEAGVDWANVGSPTTANALTNTSIITTQQVDVNTIKTQAVTCAAGVTIRADVGAAAAPGAANGMLIGGSNAATTFAGLTTGALSCTTITASGAVAFQSTFAVTTSTSLGALSATTVTFSGAVAFQSTFVVTTSSNLGALSCTTFTASGAVAFQSTFAVTTSTALGALSCTTLTASGAVAFQSTFAVTTSTNLAALSCSTFGASGTVTFNAFTCTNNFTVSGTTTLTGAVSMGSTFGVMGTVTFNAFTVTNNFTVSGNWLTTGTTTWTGAATFTNGVTTNITGNITGNLVGTVSTLTTYTGNTPQTGDSFALANGVNGFVATKADTAAIKSKTDNLPTDPADASDIATLFTALTSHGDSAWATATSVTVSDKTGFALTSAYDFAKGTVAMTESYAANGAAMTPVQALYAAQQYLMDFVISGTSYTVKKLDNSTTAFVVTLNDATTPTGAVRA